MIRRASSFDSSRSLNVGGRDGGPDDSSSTVAPAVSRRRARSRDGVTRKNSGHVRRTTSSDSIIPSPSSMRPGAPSRRRSCASASSVGAFVGSVGSVGGSGSSTSSSVSTIRSGRRRATSLLARCGGGGGTFSSSGTTVSEALLRLRRETKKRQQVKQSKLRLYLMLYMVAVGGYLSLVVSPRSLVLGRTSSSEAATVGDNFYQQQSSVAGQRGFHSVSASSENSEPESSKIQMRGATGSDREQQLLHQQQHDDGQQNASHFNPAVSIDGQDQPKTGAEQKYRNSLRGVGNPLKDASDINNARFTVVNAFPPPYPVIARDPDAYDRLSKDALEMCKNALWHSVETTTIVLPNDETFVFEGDVDELSLRDSAAQVHTLLAPSSSSSYGGKALIHRDQRLDRIVSGLIKRTAMYIRNGTFSNIEY